jgi:hypothetical protein
MLPYVYSQTWCRFLRYGTPRQRIKTESLMKKCSVLFISPNVKIESSGRVGAARNEGQKIMQLSLQPLMFINITLSRSPFDILT